jgi:hypothetical protein
MNMSILRDGGCYASSEEQEKKQNAGLLEQI